jgi:hypothetical protein
MADDQSKPEAPTEHPAMGQIVGSLKDYPFLLITVAGLLILSGILIFDLEKLKEFKWLIYAVVLVPLGIQFLIEFKKMQAARPGLPPRPRRRSMPERRRRCRNRLPPRRLARRPGSVLPCAWCCSAPWLPCRNPRPGTGIL